MKELIEKVEVLEPILLESKSEYFVNSLDIKNKDKDKIIGLLRNDLEDKDREINKIKNKLALNNIAIEDLTTEVKSKTAAVKKLTLKKDNGKSISSLNVNIESMNAEIKYSKEKTENEKKEIKKTNADLKNILVKMKMNQKVHDIHEKESKLKFKNDKILSLLKRISYKKCIIVTHNLPSLSACLSHTVPLCNHISWTCLQRSC